MKRISVIINPISGTASKKHIPMLLDQYIPSNKFEKQFFFTEYHGHAFEMASQAVQNRSDFVIAVGGDGTVNEVAKALIHSSSVLGIIPMGSGNGLARDLFIPMDVRKAIEVIAEQQITCIDYCKANEQIFFCTCGVGFDALISKRLAEKKRRGPFAYLKSIAIEYLSFKPDTYEIILEDKVLTKKAFLLTCANASQYGNNAFIAPHARMNDGVMDIAILFPFTFWDLGPLIVQMFTKQIDKNSKTEYYKAKQVILKRKKPGIVHVDGEPIQMGDIISIRTIHNGLNVIVPNDPVYRDY
ncbi:MAG: diacylglycerol kinase family lipid kinase [Dysgonamonadaceae bacterium]|jgi:YegS/Rv2252/BmrU family lipid kinase|nr:diacylglycerol kinase family lipid kinase [Dysgonamonadaceae bacterium]